MTSFLRPLVRSVPGKTRQHLVRSVMSGDVGKIYEGVLGTDLTWLHNLLI